MNFRRAVGSARHALKFSACHADHRRGRPRRHLDQRPPSDALWMMAICFSPLSSPRPTYGAPFRARRDRLFLNPKCERRPDGSGAPTPPWPPAGSTTRFPRALQSPQQRRVPLSASSTAVWCRLQRWVSSPDPLSSDWAWHLLHGCQAVFFPWPPQYHPTNTVFPSKCV